LELHKIGQNNPTVGPHPKKSVTHYLNGLHDASGSRLQPKRVAHEGSKEVLLLDVDPSRVHIADLVP